MSELPHAGASTPAPADLSAQTLDPLVRGTTLLDRFTVVEVLSSDGSTNMYRVAVMRQCPNCGVDNEGNLTHCGFCGTELPAARTLALVEQSKPSNGQVIPASFTLDGLTYTFARDLDTAAEPVERTVRLEYGFVSDPGLARGARGEPNEDSVLTMLVQSQYADAAPTLGVFMVADGVGGAEAGEVASRMAVQSTAHALLARLLAPTADDAPLTGEMIHDALRDAIGKANRQVIEYAQTHEMQPGTTITLAVVRDGRAYFANVGDSRAYLMREHALTQVTRDHSYVAGLVANGEIAPDEARVHPQRNLILRSLGDPSGFEVDLFPAREGLTLGAGDQIMLCSDGLWEMVSDEDIARVLSNTSGAQEACGQLVGFANAAGGADNISVVVVRAA